MAVPVLDLKAQYAGIRSKIDAAVQAVLESGHFVLGPNASAAMNLFCIGISHHTETVETRERFVAGGECLTEGEFRIICQQAPIEGALWRMSTPRL